MRKKIYLSSPHMSAEGYEMEYIKEAFDTNWIAPLGPNVDEFEKEFATKVGAKHAAALSSGTAAIHLALIAAGVGAGDLVFCQSLTFSATANPIIYQNATPVFIDSDYETWNMCPRALEEALEKYKQAGRLPKAVIVVHLYGLAADLEPILELCRRYAVPLIEDAAESLGTLYQGKYTGTFGDYGIFSFNGNKIITTSGGGMLVSDDEEKIAKVRFRATQARDPVRHYQHSELGFNYRLSNVLAGIGRGQLKVLDQRVAKKRYIFEYYRKELGGLAGVQFMPAGGWNEQDPASRQSEPDPTSRQSEPDPTSRQSEHDPAGGAGRKTKPPGPANKQGTLQLPSTHSRQLSMPVNGRNEQNSAGISSKKTDPLTPINKGDESNCWLSCLTLDGPIKPPEIIETLETANIESRPLWKPMHLQPFFAAYDYINSTAPGASASGVSANLFKKGLCLPSDTKMTDEDLQRVVKIVKQLFER